MKKIGILCFFYDNKFIGSTLSVFSLYRMLKTYNYDVKVIDFLPKNINNENESLVIFKQDLFEKTKTVTIENIEELNKDIDTFIVGPEHLWHPSYFVLEDYAYFLSFANKNKKLIAYAVSFGCKNPFFTEEDKHILNLYMSRFDYIGVRETSGLEILQKSFNLLSDIVLDPIFYIDEFFPQKVGLDTKGLDNLILSYFMDSYLAFSSERQLKLTNYNNPKINIFKFYYSLKHAKFVLTDSYHIVCLCLLFNIPFTVVLRKGTSGGERIDSLYKLLQLPKTNIIFTVNNMISIDFYREKSFKFSNNKISCFLLKYYKSRSRQKLISAIEEESSNKYKIMQTASEKYTLFLKEYSEM